MSGHRMRAVCWLVSVMLAVLAPAAALAAPSASVVMDARSGEIIFARNHDTRLHPASLTKMMTLYIAFEAVRNGEISLDTPVRISANAAGAPCSCLGLRAGQTIALRYLLRAAAIRSANDAATAIGEAISGSEAAFIARMNRTAAALGMTNTTFRNAHGLTAPGHLSTARDMTILGRQLYFDYPEYWNLWSRRSADAGIAQVNNTNSRFLDGYSGADGIKTGFTRAAGFNLTASAERGGRRIIVTVFGGQSVPDRTRRVIELMDLGFDRAPARVAVRRPPPPNYGTQPPGAPAAAMAQAGSGAATGDRPAAGRTIRIATAVSRSPIPPVRPTPATAAPAEAAIAALQEGIDAAVAGVTAAPDPAPARPLELAAVLPQDDAPEAARPFSLAAAAPPPPPLPAEAVPAEDATASDPDSAAHRPFQLAEAAPDSTQADTAAPLREDDDGATDLGSDLAVAAAPLPPRRPEALVVAEETADEAAPETMALADEDPNLQLAEAVDTEPLAAGLAVAAASPDPAAEVTDASRSGSASGLASGTAVAAAPPAAPPTAADRLTLAALPALGMPAGSRRADTAGPAAIPAPAATEEPMIVLTYTPPAGAEPLRLAALTEAGRAEPARPPAATPALAAARPAPAIAGEEVVLRQISTSEPRMWSVSLGRHGTRDGAERALMRAALAELASFDGALRRVQPRSGGFEATFVGLTEWQAISACERLRARDRDCAVQTP